MPSEQQIDAATDAYLRARGWSDDKIAASFLTRSEVRGRMKEALLAAEQVADVQNKG